MKRLFIRFRIEYNESLAILFNELKEKLTDERIKWVDQSGIHVTLAFLGSMDESVIPRIGDILNETAGKFPAFEVELGGVGVFRKLTDPGVLMGWT
ncbi:MAG: 2'-5' RNA ligase family protein [Bacteroidales bacterium]